MRSCLVAATAALLVVTVAGCGRARHSPSGFRLPPGEPAAGQTAFIDLKCHTCHRVEGVELPPAEAPNVVTLGGKRALPPTDGDLTTDIILPSSHFASGYPASQVQEGARSRMPDYTRQMTIRQLADLVAFLQARYTSPLGGRGV